MIIETARRRTPHSGRNLAGLAANSPEQDLCGRRPFLARVRELGEYVSQDEAAKVTEAVLNVLARRISPGKVGDLASQLSGPLGQTLADVSRGRPRVVGLGGAAAAALWLSPSWELRSAQWGRQDRHSGQLGPLPAPAARPRSHRR